MNFAPRLSTCSLAAGPHVGRRHDGAEPARRRDRLQAGDAGAHDEDLGGRDGAGRRHHHRHGAAIFGGAVDHGAIAGEIGLRGQHVHGLRPGDARHQFHGKRRDAGLGHGGERGVVAERVHDGDDECARLVGGEFGRAGAAHLEHDVGVAHGVGGQDGAGRRIVLVADAGREAGPRLDRHFGAERLHFLDGFGGRGDPRFGGITFPRNRNAHARRLPRLTGRDKAASAIGVEQQRQTPRPPARRCRECATRSTC